MKVRFLVPWLLSAMLMESSIFQILIHPTGATSEPADYMYDLDEDGIGDENGIDFGSPFEPLTFTSYSRHNHNEEPPDLKTNASASFGIITFDIETDERKKEKGKVEERDQGNIINISIKSNENDDRFQSKLSWTGDRFFGCLLVTFCFLAVVGNSCTLIVFCFRHRKLSPAEVFFVNLAIVDILLSIASYPMSTIASFKHRWDFGEFGCTLYAFVCYFLGVASIFSITAIALIRYLKTCNPAKGNQITCWTSCKMIAVGYVVALFWAVMPLVGFGNYGFEPYGLSCTLDWVAKDRASRIYILLVTIFCVFLPLFIILFCYSQIIILVKQSDALMQSNGVNKRNMKASDVQLTWISAVVAAGFILAWCPYSIVCLWGSFRGEVVLPMWATPVPVLMAKSSVAYNPFIYIFFAGRYREDFMGLVQRWIYSHTKVSKQSNNNNDRATDRSNFKRSTKAKNINNGTDDTGNISPGNSGSSSLVTRQFTSTTCIPLTSVNYGAATAIPLVGAIQLRNLAKENSNNNLDDDHDNGHLNELAELVEETDEYDEHDHSNQRETTILIFRNETSNQNNYSGSHVPSQVITMFTGNGTNTVVTTTRSTTRKLMSISSSLLSLRSECSSVEEEQQV